MYACTFLVEHSFCDLQWQRWNAVTRVQSNRWDTTQTFYFLLVQHPTEHLFITSAWVRKQLPLRKSNTKHSQTYRPMFSGVKLYINSTWKFHSKFGQSRTYLIVFRIHFTFRYTLSEARRNSLEKTCPIYNLVPKLCGELLQIISVYPLWTRPNSYPPRVYIIYHDTKVKMMKKSVKSCMLPISSIGLLLIIGSRT